MPGRPIVIEWAAQVREWLRGTDQVERSVDDIAKGLKDASDDAERFEGDFQNAMRDSERAASRAADKIGDDFGKVKKDLGDIGDEAGSEFKQNLGESLASGDLEDLLTDTLGGMVSGLKGPLGLAAAGLAGIAALAFGEMKKQAEEAAAFVASTLDAINSMFEAGFLAADQQRQLEAFTQWAEENADKFKEWEAPLASVGIRIEDYVQALYNGGQEQADMLATLRLISQETETQTTGQGVQREVETDRAGIAKGLLKSLEEQAAAQSDQQGTNALLRDLYREQAEALGLSSAHALEVADTLNSIPKDVQVSIGLDYYLTPQGQATLDRASASYSPGHVAIFNSKVTTVTNKAP
jgi:hypothetical protein